MTAISAIFGRSRARVRAKDPDYMKTDRFDGKRSVDRKKFIENEAVRKQIRELAKNARDRI